MKKKFITIPKDFFCKLNYLVSLPTFKCKKCGKKILDIPSNWHLK